MAYINYLYYNEMRRVASDSVKVDTQNVASGTADFFFWRGGGEIEVAKCISVFLPIFLTWG